MFSGPRLYSAKRDRKKDLQLLLFSEVSDTNLKYSLHLFIRFAEEYLYSIGNEILLKKESNHVVKFASDKYALGKMVNRLINLTKPFSSSIYKTGVSNQV